MNWGAVMIGAVVGMLLTRSVWGFVIGATIGQLFGQQSVHERARTSAASVSETFFRTTFMLMGHVAKADGRVSESEIRAAREIMTQLRLDERQVAIAIDHFTRGKSPDFDVDESLDRLRLACGARGDLLRLFVELQMRAAIAGNDAQGAAHAILVRCAERLGLTAFEFVRMEAILRARYQTGARAESASNSTYRRPSALESAYQELGIDAAASDADVKKAYRRQMSRHHPDKLVANGLPESMAEVAKQKTQRIQEAYETICAARGIR